MNNNKVAFVGGGNMTRAIAVGLLKSGYEPKNLWISEPSAEQRDALSLALPGATITNDNNAVAVVADCIVLAVKPQVLPDVCRDLSATAQQTRPLVISIAAGVRSNDIDTWLGGGLAIVRVMPNQPALLRQGVSGVYANTVTSEDERTFAAEIMSAVGAVVQVPNETDIDAVTAISGSGPAYFFLLIDTLCKTAVEFGLTPDAARALAIKTATGAAALAASTDEPMDALIARVRSPGGTTAAALDSLEDQDVREIFGEAFTAARDRAVILANEASK